MPSYDAKAVSKVNASTKVHNQMHHEKRKNIIQTSDDDKIDPNIIFDDPYVENNGGTSDHDSNDHDEYLKIQMLAYDVQREAENQKWLNNKLKKQKILLQKELETCKDQADIGIFIGYSESSRGFRIYNHRTKKIMETIHVMFDELTNMASKCNNLEPRMNCMNLQNSSEDLQSIPSKSYLDNLFGPLYEEYYATSSQEVSDNSAANTLDNEHTSSSSSIVVKEDEAPQTVSLLAEQVATEPNSSFLNANADEFVQEYVAYFDGNLFYNAPPTPVFEEAESSSTYQDPSNMHEFHQKHRSSDRWTKNNPIEQVIGVPSKSVMTRNQLQNDAKVCIYALTVSTIKLKNIKEAMLDASWIESN
nr:hypothetical protein [Tanacetum cinerariifolium]